MVWSEFPGSIVESVAVFAIIFPLTAVETCPFVLHVVPPNKSHAMFGFFSNLIDRQNMESTACQDLVLNERVVVIVGLKSYILLASTHTGMLEQRT